MTNGDRVVSNRQCVVRALEFYSDVDNALESLEESTEYPFNEREEREAVHNAVKSLDSAIARIRTTLQDCGISEQEAGINRLTKSRDRLVKEGSEAFHFRPDQDMRGITYVRDELNDALNEFTRMKP